MMRRNSLDGHWLEVRGFNGGDDKSGEEVQGMVRERVKMKIKIALRAFTM